MTQKVSLKSMSVTDDKKAKLKELFPEVFAEDKIDFEKLKLTLGEEVDSLDERFGLSWAGKADCFKVIQEPSVATLKPNKGESVNWDSTENLFIEGDNLEVLKQLQKAYYGKVKMIYIDPPYNTGKEFIYPDKYQENLDTYLAYTRQVDESGKKFSTNSETIGRFHSNWLNMMYPRLFIARNLLSNDGVIFISIDDNEIHNLRKICDEIFGEENFLGNIVRSTGQTTGQDSGGLGSSFDFVLAYSKNEVDLSGLRLNEKDLKRFENEDETGKYAYDQMRKTGSSDTRKDRPNMFYPVYSPDGTEVFPIAPAGYEGRWRFEKSTYEQYLSEGLILWKKTKRNGEEIWWPYVKYYLEGRTKRPSPLWTDLDGNKKASRDLRTLFDGKKIFDFPKPIQLIKRLIEIVPNASSEDIILDFFAGSGSTAQAVLEINKELITNKKFICVQLPEQTDGKSEAYKAGYINISDIGKERIRRVINKIQEEQEEEKSKAEKEIQFKEKEEKNIDLGFKVFKLDRSNFKIWDGDVEGKPIEEQLQLNIHRIDPESSDEDLLYEILLKSGFQPTVPVHKITIKEKAVYSIAEDALLICLEKELNNDVIKAVAEKQPVRAVFLDDGFKGNDQLKTNAVQIMKSHDVKEFRTV